MQLAHLQTIDSTQYIFRVFRTLRTSSSSTIPVRALFRNVFLLRDMRARSIEYMLTNFPF